MRVAAYADFAYRRRPDGLHTDQAFVLFLAGLRPFVDRLVLVGRLDPAQEDWHYRVPEGVEFAPLPYYASLSDPLTALRSLGGAVGSFRRTLDEVDAVWLLGPHPLAIVFALVAVARRKRVVLGVRQHLPAYARHRHPGRRSIHAAALVLEAAFRLLALALPVVVIGPDLARRYRFGRRVLAVPVSLMSEREVGRARPEPGWDGPLQVLSVGRLDAEKNPLLLADVLAALDERWRLVVCGEGPLAGALEQRLVELGVRDRADLLGYVPLDGGLLDAYRASHAFLHVSWTEGFPQVLVEAFAAGVPVVATAVGGTAALAGDAALLIGPGDAGAAAAALERLREDSDLRARLVARGREVAAEHTLERIGARVAALLTER